MICNWIGGEAVSLALARASLPHVQFSRAGYADIATNASYTGGHVRQFGNLSFSRVFDSGHTVPAYQGETAYAIFSRIINGEDIGTGGRVDLSRFGTRGPVKSFHENKVPPQPQNTCWIRAITDTCTKEQRADINKGLGIVKNGQWFAQPAAPPSYTRIQSRPRQIPALPAGVGETASNVKRGLIGGVAAAGGLLIL